MENIFEPLVKKANAELKEVNERLGPIIAEIDAQVSKLFNPQFMRVNVIAVHAVVNDAEAYGISFFMRVLITGNPEPQDYPLGVVKVGFASMSPDNMISGVQAFVNTLKTFHNTSLCYQLAMMKQVEAQIVSSRLQGK